MRGHEEEPIGGPPPRPAARPPKALHAIMFGSEDTRAAWERECKSACTRATSRYIVAPRYRVRTQTGWLEPEAAVTEADFVGYHRTDIDSNSGKTTHTPITPSQAFRQALELGVVLDTDGRQ